jgi:hypothetical protein
MKKMHIRIGRDGRTRIRVEGGQGDDCLPFTQAVENALGEVEDRELLPEYEETDPLTVYVAEEEQETADF